MIVKRLATSLCQDRFRSVVCLFRTGWLFDTCEQAGLPTHVLSINGAFDIHWARAFIRLVKAERIALIHAHEFTANTYGALLGKLLNVPVVATIHGKNYYWEQAKRRVAYRFVSRTASMIAVSENLRQFVVERVGITQNRIQVIYNGVEAAAAPSADRLLAIRGELGLAQWNHVIGTIGSLYPVKGHVYLIRALPAILRECPKTLVLIVGRGELEKDLREEASNLGVEANIHFLGFRNDIPLLLQLMEVFVLPSLSEGLSMALLEAMAAERPIVATKVGGNGELVCEGHSGYLVPSEDPDSLGDRVVRLLRNKEQGKAFGARGRQRVEETFSLAGMVNAYQSCYQQAIEKQSLLRAV